MKWGADPRAKEAKEAVRAWAKGMREPYCASRYTHREFERFWREGIERVGQYDRPVQMATVAFMAKADNPMKFSLISSDPKHFTKDRGQQGPRRKK